MDGTDAAYIANVVRICQLVPTIVTLYDHLITFDQEVELVWDKPWSIAKILFLWNRYFGSFFLLAEAIVFSIKPPSNQLYVFHMVASLLAFRSCRTWFFVQDWSTAIIIWSMQSVMLFRTFAMYHHSQVIVTFCLLLYAAEVVAMSAVTVASFRHLDALREPYPGIYICTPNNAPHFFYLFWIPAVALDSILLTLALWTCILHVRGARGLLFPRSPMWEVLLTDSLFYFSVTLSTYIANVVVGMVLPAHWLKLPQGFSAAGTCVMGIRLVLNLRRAYYVPSPGNVDLDSVASQVLESFVDATLPLQDVLFVKGDVARRLSETWALPRPPESETAVAHTLNSISIPRLRSYNS